MLIARLIFNLLKTDVIIYYIIFFSILICKNTISKEEIIEDHSPVSQNILEAQKFEFTNQFEPDKKPAPEIYKLIDCYRCCVGFKFKDYKEICKRHDNFNSGHNCKCENK